MKIFQTIYDVRLHMKSGNTIVLDKVKSCTISGTCTVTGISNFSQSKHAENELYLHSLDLTQIEAITSSKIRRIFAFNY